MASQHLVSRQSAHRSWYHMLHIAAATQARLDTPGRPAIGGNEGREGGYLLAREPAEISLLEVVRAIDGDEPVFRCTEMRQRGPLATKGRDCRRACAVARAMTTAEDAWRASLAATSIADLVEEVDCDTSGRTLPRMREWLANG